MDRLERIKKKIIATYRKGNEKNPPSWTEQRVWFQIPTRLMNMIDPQRKPEGSTTKMHLQMQMENVYNEIKTQPKYCFLSASKNF